MDYCNSILASLPKSEIHRLQLVQNATGRVVCRKKKFDHISPILNALHWLPVEKRIQYKVLCNAQKFVTGQVPEYFDDLLNLYKPARPLRSSNKTLFEVPPLKEVKTHKFGERTFSYIAPALYNCLPQNLKDINEISCFKRHLRTFLFQ